jgi:hypothetical protein
MIESFATDDVESKLLSDWAERTPDEIDLTDERRDELVRGIAGEMLDRFAGDDGLPLLAEQRPSVPVPVHPILGRGGYDAAIGSRREPSSVAVKSGARDTGGKLFIRALHRTLDAAPCPYHQLTAERIGLAETTQSSNDAAVGKPPLPFSENGANSRR